MNPNPIQIADLSFELLIEKKRIEERIDAMAMEISQVYGDESLLVIGVLNGAFMFYSDLVKQLSCPVETAFVKLSSYRGETEQQEISLEWPLTCQLANRHVLVVDDILDTGRSMDFLLQDWKNLQPKSIRTACLLNKPTARIKEVHLDFKGFDIEDHFVVGYGLDYKEKGRQYSQIYRQK